MNFLTQRFLYRIGLSMLLQIVITSVTFGQRAAMIPGDFPDPTVILVDGTYFAVGTSSEWGPHFPIYMSTDLQNWEQQGFVFSEPPAWAASSFWAPEYFYHEGVYYVYYSAKRKSDGVSCIGVATSRFPDRDFVDRGIVVAYGSESIDAFVVKEDDRLFMTWKAYGLDERPIEILGSELSSDGLRLIGEPFSLLQDTAKVGIEGQSFLKHNGYYYMFYAAGNCCGLHCDYHVQAVRSRTLKGPYERVGTDVLLGENEDWKCMGHGTFVKSAEDKIFYLFHGYSKTGNVYTGREGLLAQLDWSASGEPIFTFIQPENKRRYQKQDVALKASTSNGRFWQWDFRYAAPQFTYRPEGLWLTGTSAEDNRAGIALTIRPLRKAYQAIAAIDLTNSSVGALKGLVIYGDKDRAVGVGILEDKAIFWRMEKGVRRTIGESTLPKYAKEATLRLVLDEDGHCSAFTKTASTWTEIESLVPEDQAYDLPPWDRSPRPGLHFSGSAEEHAVFRAFEVVN
ncbi:MAG TPA: glycoside hydrolase family 43 protein [Sphingobacterium sp.]|nr:glycoside hydrolase family 43 protein [Sphingobacterium sp.]